MNKRDISKPSKSDETHFRTHIPEPRWQQVVSVLVVVLIAIMWFWFLLRHK